MAVFDTAVGPDIAKRGEPCDMTLEDRQNWKGRRYISKVARD